MITVPTRKLHQNSMHNRKSVISIYLIPDIVIPRILVPGYPHIQARELIQIIILIRLRIVGEYKKKNPVGCNNLRVVQLIIEGVYCLDSGMCKLKITSSKNSSEIPTIIQYDGRVFHLHKTHQQFHLSSQQVI